MAWFSTATKHFSTSAGWKTLHPVLDLNSAERFKPFCLVKRKTSFWPWKSPKLTPTPLVLNDILLKDLKRVAPSASVYIENYEDKPQLKLDGDLGMKLASELSLDLSTIDSFSMDAKFGDIIKTQLNWQDVENALKKTKAQMNHELLLRRKKRTSLCLVLESLACKKDCMLTVSSDEKVSTDDSFNIPKSPVTINVHSKGDIETVTQHSFEITPGTVLAYSCNVLEITSDGEVTLHVGSDRIDAHPDAPVPSHNRDAEINALKKEVQTLISSSKLMEIITPLHAMLGSPALSELSEIVGSAHIETSQKMDFSIADYEVRELLRAEDDLYIDTLEAIGFVSKMATPDMLQLCFDASQNRELLESCWALLDCLDDLPAPQQALLRQMSKSDKEILMHLVENGLEEQTSFNADGLLRAVPRWNGAEKELMNWLGFTVDGQQISYRWRRGDQLKDIYVALLVFVNV